MGYFEAITEKGWQIYDVTDETLPNNWEGRELQGPAEAVQIGRQYVLTPQPEEGQSLWQAYEAVQGVGPTLDIPDPKAADYLALKLHYTPAFAVFSRLLVDTTGVLLYIPQSREVKTPDVVVLHPATAEDIFVRDFSIRTLKEIMQAAHDHRERGRAN